MKIKNSPFSLIILSIVLASCGTYKNAYVSNVHRDWPSTALPSEEALHTVFLIGDAGEPNLKIGEPNLLLLKEELQSAGEKSSVIFLGDNIYPDGLPKKNDPGYDLAKIKLGASLEAVKGYSGNVFFIPGNHDWNGEKPGGRKAVIRQENYIQDSLGKGTFYPNNGCGDPEKKKLAKDFVTIFIDSHWWLHDWDSENKMNKGCEAKSRQEFLVLLEEELLKHQKDQILIVMHHPLFSNGNHGGFFAPERHLFPLRGLNKKLWIPLPIIGSAEPIYRKVSGTKQDIASRNYQEMKNSILGLLGENYKNVIFAAGHDHNLQYFKDGGHHFIVSGGGSKHSFAKKGHGAIFAHESEGFAKLYYYETGEIWLEFIVPDRNSGEKKIVFRNIIAEPKPEKSTQQVESEFPPLPDSITEFATLNYKVSKFNAFWLGKNYRKVWEAPVSAPVFDIEERGLTATKKGGGNGTNSLRLEDANGNEFVLRSVNKYPLRSVPEEFRNLRFIRFYINFNSSNHPYAVLPIPAMAKAAGIYYANTKLVYLSKQKGLGIYNELLEEGLYFFEERPDGNAEEYDNFGNSREVIGYVELLQKIREDSDARVDQEWVLKSRLFDLFIHDWDRHDDQWRWAGFDRDGHTMYRPIPRDRDAAFYKFNGMIPPLISTFFQRKYKTMKWDLKDPAGHSTNAAFFDRHFLNGMDHSAWDSLARDIQTNLTDEVIEKAFESWPDTLSKLNAEEIIGKLKSRRDKLPKIAEKYYRFLAKRVDVIGTDDEEIFEVIRLAKGITRVKVYDSNKKGEKKDLLYDRLFYPKETKEIRLYGLAGQDLFQLNGSSEKGILVRLIGGFGKDELRDKSEVEGISKNTKAYDERDGMKVENSTTETALLFSESIEANEWDREYFKYNTNFPLLNFGFTPDDQFFFGAGILSTVHGFRKDPHSAYHSFSFGLHPATNAFNVQYLGDFRGFLGEVDLETDISFNNPYFTNFFGFGNGTILTTDEFRFNRVRMQYYRVATMFKHRSDFGKQTISFGPVYESYKIENRPDQITADPFYDFDADDFTFQHFLGAKLAFELNATQGKAHPKSGLKFNSSLAYKNEFQDDGGGFFQAEGALSFYFTIPARSLEFTFASRLGGAWITGEYEFYQSPSLGASNYLRGYRNDRFRGSGLFYHNTDLRVSLFYWDNTIVPFEFGLLGGLDYGRVWSNVAEPSKIHVGYTGGIWFSPLRFLIVSPFYSFSDEDQLFSLLLGFQF